MSHSVLEHVNEVTRKHWERKTVSQGITEFEAIIKFLEINVRLLNYFTQDNTPVITAVALASQPIMHM